MKRIISNKNNFRNATNLIASCFGESYLCIVHETITSMMVGLCIIILASCGNDTTNEKFKSSKDAFNAYTQFSSDLSSCNNLSFEEVVDKISRWQELRGAVFPIISNDTTNNTQRSILLSLEQTDKYIKVDISRLVGMTQMTFADLVDLKLKISPNVDEAMMSIIIEADDFYSKLDSVKLHTGKIESLLKDYRSFLVRTCEDGISNKQAMLEFFSMEDFYFRSFLNHLDNSSIHDMTDISHLTEEACMLVYQSTEEGLISYNDAVVFMSKRNTRRMLLNAIACIDDISDAKISNKEQAMSYLWMLLQPYILIEPFDSSLMSDVERMKFHKVSDLTPMAISKLNVHLNLEPSIIETMPTNITLSLIDTF